MLGKAITQAGLLVPRAVGRASVRNMGGHTHFQNSLPTEKISKVELMIANSIITVGIMSYPAYVIFNMQEFKKQAGADE